MLLKSCIFLFKFFFVVDVIEENIWLLIITLCKLNISQLKLICQVVISSHFIIFSASLVLQNVFELMPETQSEDIIVKIKEFIDWHVTQHPSKFLNMECFSFIPFKIFFLFFVRKVISDIVIDMDIDVDIEDWWLIINIDIEVDVDIWYWYWHRYWYWYWYIDSDIDIDMLIFIHWYWYWYSYWYWF